MTVADTMNSFYGDKVFQRQFAIAFSLSMPFLIRDQESDYVAALLYQADLFDEENLECIGYLAYRDGVKYTLRPIEAQEDVSVFSLVKKAETSINSKADFEAVVAQIHNALEEIRGFVYTAPNELTDDQKKATADYTRLLRTLAPERLLGCFYAASPLFFDWCCMIAINA